MRSSLHGKLRNLALFVLCLLLYRLYRKRKPHSMQASSFRSNTAAGNSSKRSNSISQRAQDLTLHACNESLDYCVDFARRRPIMAGLIALECGSWAYYALKKIAKSFIWNHTVLELEIKGDYTMKPKDPLQELFNGDPKKLSFLELLHTIRGAGADSRVSALLIRMEQDLVMGVAQAEELRAALLAFKREHGKPIVVYADNVSQWGASALRHYYIASAATQIFMSADGILHLGATTIDFPFVAGALKEKLDITVEVRRRAQYKSAGNMFARDQFDEFHRAQYEQLVANLELNFIDTVAKSRLLRPYAAPKNGDVIECIQWVAQRILAENDALEFKLSEAQQKKLSSEKSMELLSKTTEEKSADLNDCGGKLEDEWNASLMYLVHCWSWNDGDYKRPVLFVVLQFWDKHAQKVVFYRATVAQPGRKFGKLQRGGDSAQNTVFHTDANGSEITRQLQYALLSASEFVARDFCVELVKPGDIVMPKDDEQLDSDLGLADVRASLHQQHIVIRSNVKDILHHGSYSSAEAQVLGLIDGTCTYSDIYSQIMPRVLGKSEKQISYLYLHRYFQRIFKAKLRNGIANVVNPAQDASAFEISKYFDFQSANIAYIAATNGAIIDGDSTSDRIGSVTLCRQLRAARKKKDIKGVILHLDTPGGSATACYNMHCEIKELIAASKPVIAVQSNVAASGGYYLSAPCSYIVASPSTITGSIGIIGMKFTTKNFWKNKLGVNYDRVTTNPIGASFFSQLDGFGDYERIRIEKALTDWYARFKGVIAGPRNMEMEQLETVAKGQVWFGSQALEFGLVDELGGLYEAMAKMKELLDIANYKKLKLVNPLGKMTVWDILFGAAPEHENDFSVPRTSMQVGGGGGAGGGYLMLRTFLNFLNPMAQCLGVTSRLASPLLSSVFWMSHCLKTADSATMPGIMMDNLHGMGLAGGCMRDLAFMSNELRFYKNQCALMYSPYAAYLGHNIACTRGQF